MAGPVLTAEGISPNLASRVAQAADVSSQRESRYGNDSRQRILDAAEREFATKGYAGSRINDIAAASGLSVRMIYHYFEDKAGLYEAVARHNFSEILSSIRDRQIETRDLPPVERLHAFVEANILAFQGHAGYLGYSRWELASGWSVLNSIAIDADEDIISLLQSDFCEAVRDGDIDPDVDLEFFVTTVATLGFCYSGMLPRTHARLGIAPDAETSSREHAARVADFVVRGMARRGSDSWGDEFAEAGTAG